MAVLMTTQRCRPAGAPGGARPACRAAAASLALLLAACGGDGAGGASDRLEGDISVTGLSVEPSYPWVHNDVQMRATCSGEVPMTFSWDFGDGVRLAGEDAATAHTFAPRAGGQYPVVVGCTDPSRQAPAQTFTLELYQRNLSVVGRARCEGAYAGQGWCRQQPQATGPLYRQVLGLDADTMWGIGREGTVLRARTDRTQSEHLQRVRAFAAAGRDKAWAAHDGGIAVTQEGSRGAEARWFTTWPVPPAAAPGASAPPAPRVPLVKAFDAINASTVWALADDGVLRTTNGGNTWERTAWSAAGKQTTTLFAANASTAWVVGKAGLIEVTRDAGKTWKAEAPAVAASGAEYTAASASNGRSVAWLAAADGSVLQLVLSTNAWTKVREAPAQAERINAIAFSGSTAWLAGQRLISTAGTATEPLLWRVINVNTGSIAWTDVPMGSLDTTLRSVGPYRGDAAWVAGDRALYRVTIGSVPDVYYQLGGSTQTLRAFHAANQADAWAVGDGRRVMRTDDGGLRWQVRSGLASLDFKSVLAIDSNIAWAVAGTGEIYKTNDGAVSAASWQPQVPASGVGALQALSPAGSTEADWRAGRGAAWVAGAAGALLRTTDGGTTWQAPPCSVPADVNVARVAARSASAAWLVGQSASANARQLYKVGDSPAPCGAVSLPQSADVQAVSLAVELQVWALGKDTGAGNPTALWRSTNGGTSWQRIVLPQVKNPLALAGGTSSTAWIVTPSAFWKVWFDATGQHVVKQAELDADLGPVLDLQWLDNQTLWGAGTAGQVWKSLTGGDHLGSQGPKPGRVGPPAPP